MMQQDQLMLLRIASSLCSSLEHLIDFLEISDESKAHYCAMLSELAVQLDRRYSAIHADDCWFK